MSSVRGHHKMQDPAIPKFLYSGNTYENQAFIFLDPNYVAIAANMEDSYDVGLILHKHLGTIVQGPFAMNAALNQIRVCPKSCFNPLLESYVPSTLYTPIPVLWPKTPFSIDTSGITSAINSSMT